MTLAGVVLVHPLYIYIYIYYMFMGVPPASAPPPVRGCTLLFRFYADVHPPDDVTLHIKGMARLLF